MEAYVHIPWDAPPMWHLLQLSCNLWTVGHSCFLKLFCSFWMVEKTVQWPCSYIRWRESEEQFKLPVFEETAQYSIPRRSAMVTACSSTFLYQESDWMKRDLQEMKQWAVIRSCCQITVLFWLTAYNKNARVILYTCISNAFLLYLEYLCKNNLPHHVLIWNNSGEFENI